MNLEEILKNNDELTKKHKIEEQKAQSLEIKNRALEAEQKETEVKVKGLERQKQLDEMAIAGLKSIKDDSANEIVRLNEVVRMLKLDLLAEKQLRRLYQCALHVFDPHNINYNIEALNTDQPREQTDEAARSPVSPAAASVIFKAKSPFPMLNCEAKSPAPLEIDPSDANTPSTSYTVPIKIQKATKELPRLTPKIAKRLSQPGPNFPLRDITQSGFQFIPPEVAATTDVLPAQPTVSTQSEIASTAPAASDVSSSTSATSTVVPRPQFEFGSSSGSCQSGFNFLKSPILHVPSSTPAVSNHQGFTFPAPTGNLPSTSQVTAAANNQIIPFGGYPKFNNSVSDATATLFNFPSNLRDLPTFQQSASTSTSLARNNPPVFSTRSLNPFRNTRGSYDSPFLSGNASFNAMQSGNNSPKTSDR